jgi:membrane protease YdiL (CAAX protease family)
MKTVLVYFTTCVAVMAAALAMHLGGSSQLLVLLMGLAVFPLQKYVLKSGIRELGFRGCGLRSIAEAVVIPVAVLAAVAAVDLMFGMASVRPLGELGNPFSAGASFSSVWAFAGFLSAYAVILFALELVTEELMFRGFILGAFHRLGLRRAVLASAAIFSVWHVPLVVWEIGFDPLRTPVYLVNMLLLGLVLGEVYLWSKSLFPVALFHALWNDLEYNVFGFANQQMLLVGPQRALFDPEEGVAGTLVLAAAWLLVKAYARARAAAVPAGK